MLKSYWQIIVVAVLLLHVPLLCISQPVTDAQRIARRDVVLKNINPPALPDFTVSITKLGAKGDSLTNCKPAFDKAMKLALKHGGIKVVVPAGIYFVDGPIHLVSNVCIELQKGARLKFGSNPKSYLPVVLTSWEGTLVYNYSPFIYGYKLENVSIIGEGVIDGNSAETFNKWRSFQKNDLEMTRFMNHNQTPVSERRFGDGHYLRPQLIQLFECKNILIEGVKIINSPFWCIHLLKSENITVRGLKYDAQNLNNDGIDPEYSKNILIENIDFNNGDDNVAIKSGRDYEGRATALPTENIIIRNCRFKGLHGVVVGSEMSAGVQNVFVENCTYGGYCKRGIYLKSNPDRGGFIRNIFVNNVEFGQVVDAFYITSFYHGEGKGFATDIHDVYINNLKCKEATNAGIVIQGFPSKKPKNIYFTNFTVDKAKIGVSINNAENVMMENVNIGGIVNDAPSVGN
jgi:polygalacturonase